MIAGKLGKHNVIGVADAGGSGIIGPVVAVDDGVGGNLTAVSHHCVGIGPQHAIVAVLLVNALAGIIVDIGGVAQYRMADVGAGNTQIADNVAVLALPIVDFVRTGITVSVRLNSPLALAMGLAAGVVLWLLLEEELSELSLLSEPSVLSVSLSPEPSSAVRLAANNRSWVRTAAREASSAS